MINAEIWLSGRGGNPVWQGKLPVVPREGERMQVLGNTTSDPNYSGKVWRVTWIVSARMLVKVRITLDDVIAGR